MQGLAHIDVAQARDGLLVEQQGLGPLLAVGEGLDQGLGVEAVAQRLGTHGREPGMMVDPVRGDQVHEAEATGVMIGDDRAVVGFEHHVGVLVVRRDFASEIARTDRAFGGGDLEPAGHAQVHHQGVAAIQRSQQVLGPAVQPQDLRARQPLDEAVGQGEAQVGAVGAHAGQARAAQHRLQAAAHGLDFGQFGQGGPQAGSGPPDIGHPARGS